MRDFDKLSIAAACAAVLGLAGCGGDPAQPPAAPMDGAAKAGSSLGPWVSNPRAFARDVEVLSLAATPARLLGTTPSGVVQFDDAGGVQLFAPGFAAADPQLAVSPGFGGFAAGDLYVTDGSDIYQMPPDGAASAQIASLPPGDGPIAGMCFDRGGTFAYELLVLTTSGAVHRIDAGGRVLRAGDVGAGGRGPDVAPVSFPQFGGRLLVAFPRESEVRSLGPAGDVALALRWSGACGVAAIPDEPRACSATGAALFVATADGCVYRHPQAPLSGRGGQIVLFAERSSGSGLLVPEGGGFRWLAFARFLGAERAAAFVQRFVVTPVVVDVLPGNDANLLQPGSTALVPVGLLSAGGFVPSTADGADLTLGGARPVVRGRATYAHLDDDGVLDLVLRFRPSEMALVAGVHQLVLEGTTLGGERLRGSDRVLVLEP